MIDMDKFRVSGAILAAAVLAALLLAGQAILAAESGLGLDHDPNQKINIAADSMEVRQSERVANFKGNVVAVQGNLTMKADAVKVFYSVEKESGTTTKIDRIDAQGNVHLDAPNESATGNWGIYDVGRELVTIGGTVMLKRGETLIKGSRLELDLKTGKSRMVSASSADDSGRVQGVFAPPTGDKAGDKQ
jgi:lipopolysaccharide export system protein LptA